MTEEYRVAASVKGYLSGFVRAEIDTILRRPGTKEDIIQSMTSFVHFSNKARYRGCLVLSACLMDSYNKKERVFRIVENNGKANRFVNQCFNPKLGQLPSLIVPPNIVHKMENSFPARLVVNDNDEVPTGYSTFISDMANVYATCAANHLRSNFFIYQRRSIVSMLQSLGHKNPKRSCRQLIEDLMRRINNWANHDDEDADADPQDDIVPDNHDDASVNDNVIEHFVQYHRSFFINRGLDNDLIDGDWVDDNLGYIGLYFVHILSYLHRLQQLHPQLKVKRFNVLPIHRIAAGHISIDNKCLYYILRGAGLSPGRYDDNLFLPPSETGCASYMKRWWPIIFRVEKGVTANRQHYAPMGICTNGTMASLLYMKKLDAYAINIAQDPQETYLGPETDVLVNEVVPNGEEDVPLQDHEDELVQDDDVTEDAQGVVSSPQDPSSHVPLVHAHGAVDPGIISMWFMVCTTIVNPSKKMDDAKLFSIENVPGYFEYTAAAYKNDSKISYLMNHVKTIQDELGLPRIYLYLSNHHFKTPSLREFYRAIHCRTADKAWDRLWEFAFRKSVMRARGYVDGQKKSSKQKKMNEIKKKMSDAGCELKSVGFGNGGFATSNPGTVGGGVPTRSNKELFSNNFNCYSIDEFRTSSVCPNCECQLHNLYHIYKGIRYYIRGIKYCSSDRCADHRFWHRDQVGAINILKRHLVDRGLLNPEHIPYYLQRAASVLWRPNSGVENRMQIKSSRPCILPRKKQKKNARERKKARKQRKRNRVQNH
eukprot:scaffold2415_cov73-Skeletonema_menzelii.AAC.2